MLVCGANTAIRMPAPRFRQGRRAMTIKNWFLLAAMLTALVLPSLLVFAVQPPRLSLENCQRIKDGMTRMQVEAILGPPTIRSKDYFTYHIHFVEENGFWDGSVHTTVIHTISFDKADRVTARAWGCVSERRETFRQMLLRMLGF